MWPGGSYGSPVHRCGVLQEIPFLRDACRTNDVVGFLPAVCQHGAFCECQIIIWLAQLHCQGAYAIKCEINVCLCKKGTRIALV